MRSDPAGAPPPGTWFALYPPVGGGRGSYPQLWSRLGGDACHRPVLPGRDGRYGEPALTDFEALGDDLWVQLGAELDAGRRPEDLVLFGFSMGALLATEMAERVQRRGPGPRALVVAGCAPPHVMTGRRLSTFADDELTDAIAEHSSTPDLLLDDELVRLMLPVWRSDCAAIESHPRRPVLLGCPVLAVVGESDPLAPAADVAVWSRVGGPGSTVRTVPGGHGDLLTADDVLLAAVLDGARGTAGVSS